MSNMKSWIFAGVAAAVVVGMALVGCESTKSTGDAITVTPSTTNMVGAAGFTLTATLGNTNVNYVLPLTWTVNDESLGHIEGRGVTAVYTSTGKVGSNTIKVEDQADGEGIAVVNQEAAPSTP